MGRLLLLLLLLPAVPARAQESRLGVLVRWYLREKSPSRREDFLEQIERVSQNDPAKVAAAIRRGEHLQWPERPVLSKGGPEPRFSLTRPRLEDVAASAGDYAQLIVPRGYTPDRAFPLMVELGRMAMQPPPDALLLRVDVMAHEQARKNARAAEALVLSLVAHLFEIAHIDPDRIGLRAEAGFAPLAWYIALHNPDRFAGVLGARGIWREGAALAGNGAFFRGLLIERRKGDAAAAPFLRALQRFNPDHELLHAPVEPARDAALSPAIESWWKACRRPAPPRRIELATDRAGEVRAFWISMVPLVRSQRTARVGRAWTYRALARPSTLSAELKPDNLVVVRAERVNKFVIHIDPALFSSDAPLRVSVNGQVPIARPVYFEVSDLLEDYRARRDPHLLACCELDYGVR